jgi:hypothetical protein
MHQPEKYEMSNLIYNINNQGSDKGEKVWSPREIFPESSGAFVKLLKVGGTNFTSLSDNFLLNQNAMFAKEKSKYQSFSEISLRSPIILYIIRIRVVLIEKFTSKKERIYVSLLVAINLTRRSIFLSNIN